MTRILVGAGWRRQAPSGAGPAGAGLGIGAGGPSPGGPARPGRDAPARSASCLVTTHGVQPVGPRFGGPLRARAAPRNRVRGEGGGAPLRGTAQWRTGVSSAALPPSPRCSIACSTTPTSSPVAPGVPEARPGRSEPGGRMTQGSRVRIEGHSKENRSDERQGCRSENSCAGPSNVAVRSFNTSRPIKTIG